MKHLSVLLVLSTVVLAGQNPPAPATLVLQNGKIVTVDAAMPEAQAVAIRGDRIVAVGTNYKWAVARNYLFVNPVSTVERFRIPKRSLPKFLTTDQLRKLLAACNEWEP